MPSKILIIDDDEDILAILEIIFADEGYELILSRTGINAEALQQIKPHLILLDVRIAGYGKTGNEMCREFKLHPQLSAIPVVLISAEHNLAGLAENCGADAYISKPFDLQSVVKKVKEFVS